jgi:hypothetical protein
MRYQARQREIDKQARILATQGVSAIRISQQLGIDVARVRKIARIELDAYQQRAKAQVKSLARAGINPAQIATQVGISERTVYNWARIELKIARREKDARRRRGQG